MSTSTLDSFNLMLSYIFGVFGITLVMVGLIVENVNTSPLNVKNGVICEITGYAATLFTVLILSINAYSDLPDSMYTKVLTTLSYMLCLTGLLFLISILSKLRLNNNEISSDYLTFSIVSFLLSVLIYGALIGYSVAVDWEIVKRWNNVILQGIIMTGIVFFFIVYVQYNILSYFVTSG